MKEVNSAIRDELKADGSRYRQIVRIEVIGLILTAVGLVVGIIGVVATREVGEDVEALSEQSQQDIVSGLRIGMSAEELRSAMATDPAIDDIVGEQVISAGLVPGTSIRRILYWLKDRDLVITALADAFDRIRIFAVTTMNDSLRVTFPPDNHGSYAERFVTGKSTLEEISDICLNVGGGGFGVSWGYLAMGCQATGASAGDMNIVGINAFGPPGMPQGPLQEQDLRTPDAELASFTFNTFGWGDYRFIDSVISTPIGEDAFYIFVHDFQLGPWRDEPFLPIDA